MIQTVNNRGVSLATVLVFAAVAMTAAIGIATILSYSVFSVNSVEAKINSSLLAQAVQDRLTTKGICTTALSGKPFDVASASTTYPGPNFRASQQIDSLDLTGAGIGLLVSSVNGQTGTKLDPSTNPAVHPYNLLVYDLRFLNARSINAPANTRYAVDLYAVLGSYSQTLGASVLGPKLLAQIVVDTGGGGSIQSCEAVQPYYMVMCGIQATRSVYMPNGHRDVNGVTWQDNVNQPVASNCVDFNAWQGLQGPPGPPGIPGPPGPNAFGAPSGPPGGSGGVGVPAPIFVPVPIPGPPIPAPPPLAPPPPPPPVPPPVIPPPPPVPIPPFIPPHPVKFSDSRVKKETASFDYGLAEVLKLRPIWFRYNGLAGTTAGEENAGVIAQELEMVAPKLVESVRVPLKAGDRDASDVRRVRYDAFDMMLIRAVQEQQAQIRELRAELHRSSSSERNGTPP